MLRTTRSSVARGQGSVTRGHTPGPDQEILSATYLADAARASGSSTHAAKTVLSMLHASRQRKRQCFNACTYCPESASRGALSSHRPGPRLPKTTHLAAPRSHLLSRLHYSGCDAALALRQRRDGAADDVGRLFRLKPRSRKCCFACVVVLKDRCSGGCQPPDALLLRHAGHRDVLLSSMGKLLGMCNVTYC